jgi:putative cell wall-binding protein
MRKIFMLVVVSALVLATGALPASGYDADFFAADTGGQAVYENMAIKPQAVHRDGVTYIAYQGPNLHPYVIAYKHATKTWTGPVMVAENPLSAIRDTHGGPALVVDNAGYLHVYFGAHNGAVRHVKSPRPGVASIDAATSPWDLAPNLSGNYSYPQPFYRESDGVTLMAVRRDKFNSYAPYESGWQVRKLSPTSSWWSTPTTQTPIVADSSTSRWYASTEYDQMTEELHVGLVGYRWWQTPASPMNRNYVYYLKMLPDGRRVTAAGTEITATVQPGYTYPNPANYGPSEDDLKAAGALIPGTDTLFTRSQNQVVVREDPAGNPAVMYLIGTGNGEDAYTWRISRWIPAQSKWVSKDIVTTDQFFDAGTFEFRNGDPNKMSAYLTTDGYVKPIDDYTNRGGSIVRFDWSGTNWTNTSQRWTRVKDLKTAAPMYGERYNDPQFVEGGVGEAKLLFCQWDNAGVNFVHKVFLGSDDGTFVQKKVNPQLTRLSSDNRVKTAIEVSKRSFPLGSNWVVLASAESYPDALAGVPLAYELGAPVLLVPSTGINLAIMEELQRLRISGYTKADSGVVILGGQAAVPSIEETVATVLYEGAGNVRWDGTYSYARSNFSAKIVRLGGSNRFDTSRLIADRLQAERGGVVPEAAVIASGEGFADALSVSPVAAVNGWPILLTPSTSLGGRAVEYAIDNKVPTSVIVGGTAVVPESADRLPGAFRLAGSNRYGTAYQIAQFSYENGLRQERLVVASGENFPDALAGGVLAARNRATLMITPPALVEGELHPILKASAVQSAPQAIDWYVLGGEVAVGQSVVDMMASMLGVTGQ